MSEKVKFYRGKEHKNPEPGNKGEIILLNDTMGTDGTGDQKVDGFGSIWQDDKIVGTTKASELRLTENLTVMGTNVGNITNGETLEKGMTIEDILKQMLQKEVGISKTNPTVSGFSVSPTAAVEVGAEVNATFSVTYVDGKYDSADNDLWNPDNLPMNAGCTAEATKWTYNGTEISSPHTFNAVEGDNKITYEINYGASTVTSVQNNLGQDVAVSIEGGKLTNSKTIKAYKKYFYGSVANTNLTINDVDSTVIRGLANSALFDGSSETITSFIVPANSVGILACPSNKSLTSISNAMNIAYKSEDFANLFAKSNGEVKNISNAGSGNYDVKVYIITNVGGDPAEYKNIIFK